MIAVLGYTLSGLWVTLLMLAAWIGVRR